MARERSADPFMGYNFELFLGDVGVAAFRECSGLDSSQDAVEYREGNEEPLTTRKIPGLNKYSNITLKWGVIKSSSEPLWNWRKAVQEGKVKREDCYIKLLDDERNPVVQWDFKEAWPTKWTGPSFNATGNEVTFNLPETDGETSWYLVVDTNAASPDDFLAFGNEKKVNSSTFLIAPYASIILRK